jgi:hypothetical protein
VDGENTETLLENASEEAFVRNDSVEATAVWVVYQDDEGRDYYYNTVTGDTQWEAPDENAVPADPGEAQTNDVQEQSPVNKIVVDGEEKDVLQNQASLKEEPMDVELEVDPAAKRVQEAQEALNLPDSVLEPNVVENVTQVVTSEGGNPQKAITALIDNYHGQTAICGLMARWLADLRATDQTKSKRDVSSNVTLDNPEARADEIRQVAQDLIYNIAKERFSKDTGDAILNLSKSEVSFLEDMMDSSRWRRLLIDLSASHKDSAVLMYCLNAISNRGHHREIAKRVNQSDHFAVFNAMLLSELAVIGKLAVSAGSDGSASVGLDELVNDLTRACTSTSYTYLYTIELLRFLVAKAHEDISPDVSDRFTRVIRKWEALQQELEASMMDPHAPSSVAGSSPLFRKRRLEVALTISDLYQNQRKRSILKQEADDGRDALENALLVFIRRHATGMKIDDSLLDALLREDMDLSSAEMLGELLVKNPLAVRVVLGYLFKPGLSRVNSSSLKTKCARLLALASIASEKAAREELASCGNNTVEISDEEVLAGAIMQGSQLCEQIESMVSFLVTKPTDSTLPPSPGQTLVDLALEYAPVAQGVVCWAYEFTRGKKFALSASFPTMSVSILSLVRLICLKQPFTRRLGIEIASSFLHHANPDVSYQTINAIKEQSLRLLIFMLVKGEVAAVLGGVSSQLSGTTDLDASLIRYFVSGILEVIRPPVSTAFVRAFGTLLKTRNCRDALCATYFSDERRKLLASLLSSFADVKGVDGKGLANDDRALISTLLASYQVY